jgi:cytochrome P450
VSFILYYLTVHPEAQELIYQETKNMNEELTAEDLSKAFYTRAVIQEAFRMSPVAFAVARILEEDLYLSGYHLKAGVSLLN